jgi:hypothetical protein
MGERLRGKRPRPVRPGKGETIGLIRVLAYEEPVAGSREHYQEQIESTVNEWGEVIEKIRKKADKLGVEGAVAKLKKG